MNTTPFEDMCLADAPRGAHVPPWAHVCSLPADHDEPHCAYRNHDDDSEDRFHWGDPVIGAYGIEEVPRSTPGALICGSCGRTWLEDITPSGRCPWEDKHQW